MFNRRKGKRPEGEVIEVERHKTDFVGNWYSKRTLLLYLQQS
jgi:hypothetical protein